MFRDIIYLLNIAITWIKVHIAPTRAEQHNVRNYWCRRSSKALLIYECKHTVICECRVYGFLLNLPVELKRNLESIRTIWRSFLTINWKLLNYN